MAERLHYFTEATTAVSFDCSDSDIDSDVDVHDSRRPLSAYDRAKQHALQLQLWSDEARGRRRTLPTGVGRGSVEDRQQSNLSERTRRNQQQQIPTNSTSPSPINSNLLHHQGNMLGAGSGGSTISLNNDSSNTNGCSGSGGSGRLLTRCHSSKNLRIRVTPSSSSRSLLSDVSAERDHHPTYHQQHANYAPGSRGCNHHGPTVGSDRCLGISDDCAAAIVRCSPGYNGMPMNMVGIGANVGTEHLRPTIINSRHGMHPNPMPGVPLHRMEVAPLKHASITSTTTTTSSSSPSNVMMRDRLIHRNNMGAMSPAGASHTLSPLANTHRRDNVNTIGATGYYNNEYDHNYNVNHHVVQQQLQQDDRLYNNHNNIQDDGHQQQRHGQLLRVPQAEQEDSGRDMDGQNGHGLRLRSRRARSTAAPDIADAAKPGLTRRLSFSRSGRRSRFSRWFRRC